MNDTQKIKERIQAYPDLPAFCATLLPHLSDPEIDITVLTDVLHYDPGMTANILHLANSAYYGMPRSISSLHDAVIRIGLSKIIQILIARGIAGALRHPLRGYDLRPEEMLMHAVWVAIAAEEFSKLTRLNLPPTVFTSGLLHDTGKLVLDEFVLKRQAQIDAVAADKAICHAAAETIVLGINHAEAGAHLLERWEFPPALISAARWHHEPERAQQDTDIVNMVHISNTLAHAAGIGAGRERTQFDLAPQVVANLHLTHEKVEYVASQTLDKARLLHKVLVP